MVRDAVREAVAELKGRASLSGARPAAASPAAVPATAVPPVEVRSGLVSEKVVAALPQGATLRLGPAAVVTPLARDRGVKLERIR
jgi:hypothetical protein